MAFKICFVLAALAMTSWAQRPHYAGNLPIGYPIIQTTTSTKNPNEIENRFNEDEDPSTTTMRLPIEALGDPQLVQFLSKMPVDKQPFWFINWQALEANRKRPQNYDQRPNQYIGPTSGIDFQQWM